MISNSAYCYVAYNIAYNQLREAFLLSGFWGEGSMKKAPINKLKV